MFTDWLLHRLQEKNWSQADLARASNLTTAAISKYINGRTPDGEALLKIAKALKLPPEITFRAAGLLPSVPEHIEELEELDAIMAEASEEKRAEILRYARYLISEKSKTRTAENQ